MGQPPLDVREDRAVDRGLLFANLALLLGIAFLPFPTALLADYVRGGGQNSHIAAAIYSTTMVVIGLAFMGMWAHLLQHPQLLIDGIPEGGIRTALHRSTVGPIVYGFTVGLAFISAEACFVVYAMIAVYFAAGPSARALNRSHADTDLEYAPRQRQPSRSSWLSSRSTVSMNSDTMSNTTWRAGFSSLVRPTTWPTK